MSKTSRFRYARVVFPGALMLAIAACSVQRAHTIPFDGSDNKGVVYSVPKTFLSITLQYSYTRDELRPGAAAAHLQGALKIVPLLVPDERSTFLIKTDGLLNNVMFLSSVNFKFSNGTLESVDSTSADRTGQIIEQLGTTAVNLAKAAAKGEETPHDKAMMAAERRIDDIYAAIAKASAEPLDPPKAVQNLTSLQSELDTTRKLILDLRTNVDPPLRTYTAPLAIMIDPDAPTRETADYLEYEVKPPQLFPDVNADDMDVIYVRIYDDKRRGLTDSLHAGHRPDDAGGIIYRQPVALLTKVLAVSGDDEPTEVFSGLLPFAQFSPASVAVLDSKVLTSKHTTLVLDTVNGGLVSYGIAQDSSVANTAQASGDLSNAVLQTENATKPQPVGRGSMGGGGTGLDIQRRRPVGLRRFIPSAPPSTTAPAQSPPASTQPGGGSGGRGRGGSGTAPGTP